MKTTILLILFFCCQFAVAQQFRPELVGKSVPVKLDMGKGQVRDFTIIYVMPEVLKNTKRNLLFTSADGVEKITVNGIGSGAFLVHENIWVERKVPVATNGYKANTNQHVILRGQGMIEQYDYIIYGGPNDREDVVYAALNRTETLTCKTSTNDCVKGRPTNDKIREWISDSAEMAEEFRKVDSLTLEAKKEKKPEDAAPSAEPKALKYKGLLGAIEKGKNMEEAQMNKPITPDASVDMNLIINNYNAWYEQRNPGKITYHFVDLPVTKISQVQAHLDRLEKQDSYQQKKQNSEGIEAERTAKLESLFAGRTTSATPEFASAKDNTPVKKESFEAKMQRIKSDGNKIGVLLTLMPAHTAKNEMNGSGSAAVLTNFIELEGEFMDESLRAAGQQLVNELNTTFGTTDFELITITNIPYKEVKVLGQQRKMDDWWSSKYKVVFNYTIDPRVEAENKEVAGKAKFMCSVNFLQSLMVTEYIGGPGSNKQDIHAQILNFGGFRTPYYAHDAENKDLKEIYEKVLVKLEEPLIDKVKTERANGIAKVAKRLKD